MEEDTRIQICGLIAGLASADKDIDANEANFLRRVRARFRIPKGAAVPPITDRDEAIQKLADFDEETRLATFDLLLEAATADGQVADVEREFLKSVAWMVKVDDAELEIRLDAHLAKSGPQPFTIAGADRDD